MQHLLNGGVFVYVPKNVVIEEPIQVIYLHDNDTASLFNHTLLVADENSAVTYVENYLSTVETCRWTSEYHFRSYRKR